MSKTRPLRLFKAIAESPWLIREDWAEAIRTAIALVHSHGGDADDVRSELRSIFAPLARPAAVASSYGEPLDGSRRVTVRDGVAILPAMGPMFHYADFFTELCGNTTYESIVADLRAIREAKEAGLVHAAVLEVDSPGGQVGGCGDTAKMIRALAEEMPVVSFIAELGCSGALWLASAASRVVASETSMMGSVGAVATFRLRKGSAGEEVVEIVSSQSPRKRVDVSTESGRACIQEIVDDLAEVFIQDLAHYRGVSVEKVLADFGQGGVMVGRKAVAAGLADEVGTLEALLEELAASARRTAGGASITLSQEPTMAKENTAPAGENQPERKQEPLTTAAVEKEYPQIAAELRKAGADAERARILGIQELGDEGDEQIIAQCVSDPSVSVEAAAVKLVKARKERAAAAAQEGTKAAKSYLREVKAAEQELDAPAPGNGTGSADPDDVRAAEMLSIGRQVLGASYIKPQPEVKNG